MKSTELLEMLSKMYTPPSRAFIPEFRCGTGYSRDTRADAIAMELWPSARDGIEIIGFELKVSRTDWLRELKNPYKATPVKQFCDRWYLVVSDANIVKDFDELPHDWGFIFPIPPGHPENQTDAPRLTFYKPAPKLDALPPDRAFLAALARRATRVDGLGHLVPKNNDWGKPQ